MLISGLDLIGAPILSLQTGTELARAHQAVINPHNLSVVAYEVDGPKLDHSPSLLRTDDIRELSSIGMIIDSSDEFVQPDDIIKLSHIYELQFTLVGMPVVDETRKKLGKVEEYNLESDGFVIQQLVIKRPLFQSFNDPELIIHRSQIVEITDAAIVIKSKASANQALPKAARNYTNPFRQSAPQPESVKAQHN